MKPGKMALTILIAIRKCGKLKLKSRMVKMLSNQSTEVFLDSSRSLSVSLACCKRRITPLHRPGMVWPREKTTSQVRVLVALIANKTDGIYSSSYFMPSAKFLLNLWRNPTLSAVSTTFCVMNQDTSTSSYS